MKTTLLLPIAFAITSIASLAHGQSGDAADHGIAGIGTRAPAPYTSKPTVTLEPVVGVTMNSLSTIKGLSIDARPGSVVGMRVSWDAGYNLEWTSGVELSTSKMDYKSKLSSGKMSTTYVKIPVGLTYRKEINSQWKWFVNPSISIASLNSAEYETEGQTGDAKSTFNDYDGRLEANGGLQYKISQNISAVGKLGYEIGLTDVNKDHNLGDGSVYTKGASAAIGVAIAL